MLSEQDLAEFAGRGVVRLRGAFSGDESAAMRRRVWARLARLGAAEDDPATWATADVTGLSKAIKRDAAFAALGSPAVRGAVDDLLGRGAWDPPREWGTIMFTFPGQARPWLLPARSWHADWGWDFYPEPLFGVKVFAFVAEVGPRGGGTLVITGSHQVTARFAAALPQGQPFAGHLLLRYLRGDEWFRALTRPGDDDPGWLTQRDFPPDSQPLQRGSPAAAGHEAGPRGAARGSRGLKERDPLPADRRISRLLVHRAGPGYPRCWTCRQVPPENRG
jgi:hypothetical protein